MTIKYVRTDFWPCTEKQCANGRSSVRICFNCSRNNRPELHRFSGNSTLNATRTAVSTMPASPANISTAIRRTGRDRREARGICTRNLQITNRVLVGDRLWEKCTYRVCGAWRLTMTTKWWKSKFSRTLWVSVDFHLSLKLRIRYKHRRSHGACWAWDRTTWTPKGKIWKGLSVFIYSRNVM